MSDLNVVQFFPFSPKFSSWEDWNGNLAIWYGQQPIGMFSEDNWQEGATQIMGLSTFAAYPVPDPATFSSWQEWADDFTQIINGPSR